MREVLRTNDAVLISYVQHLLGEDGIVCHVLDRHTSVLEGSIGAIPRRIAVAETDFDDACRILGNASITITR